MSTMLRRCDRLVEGPIRIRWPQRCSWSSQEPTGIVVHLREDRRHIQDRDLRLLREMTRTKLDLEMAADGEMVKIALNIRPDLVTLVPENDRN